MNILPDSIINYIISFIVKETQTSIVIKQYNKDISDNFLCFNCHNKYR